jgi:hypothetical protein
VFIVHVQLIAIIGRMTTNVMSRELELRTCIRTKDFIKLFCHLYFFLRQEIHAILLIIYYLYPKKKNTLCVVFGWNRLQHPIFPALFVGFNGYLPSLSLGLSSLCVAGVGFDYTDYSE